MNRQLLLFGLVVLALLAVQAPAQVGITEGSLAGRVQRLERMLADEVPSELPISPDLVKTITERREADKVPRRRAQLVRQINQSVVHSFKDSTGTVDEIWVRDRLTPVKDDPILASILEEYRKLGWDVRFVDGPYPNSPNNSGQYKFSFKR